MGGGAWAAGILGAVGGAAQGGMVVAKYEMDEEAERRRLYAQELKERRMAEFGLQIKREADVQDVYGIIGAQNEEEYNAFFDTHKELKPWSRDPQGLSTVLSGDYSSTREAQEQKDRDKVELEIQKEREARAEAAKIAEETRDAGRPKGYTPGSLIMTENQAADLAKQSQSGFRVPVTPTPAAINKSLNDALTLAQKDLFADGSEYGAKQETLLQGAGMSDVTSKAPEGSAYQSLLKSLAVSRVSMRAQARAEDNPEYAEMVTAEDLKVEMEEQTAKMDKFLKDTATLYTTAFAKLPPMSSAELSKAAINMVDTGQGVFGPDGKTPMNPRAVMEKLGLWNPTLRSLMVKSMTKHYMMLRRTPGAGA